MTTKTLFKKVKNPVRNNFKMAEKMIKASPVLSEMKLDIRQFYAPRKDRSIEGTFEVEVDLNRSVAQEFFDVIFHSDHFKDAYMPTVDELVARKTSDGKRLARIWKSKGVPQYWLDRYSALNFTDENVKLYLTVSSAPQMIMGVSAFGKGWGGFNGTSCLDFRFREPNQKHLLGLLSSSRVYVAFLHEGKDDFVSIKDPEKHSKAIGRATLIMDDEGKVFYNTKLYFNNNTTRDILEKTLDDMFDLDYKLTHWNVVGNVEEDYDFDNDDFNSYAYHLEKRGTRFKIIDANMKPVRCYSDFELSCTVSFRVNREDVETLTDEDGDIIGYLVKEPTEEQIKISHHGGDRVLLDSSWIFKLNPDSEEIREFEKAPLKVAKVNRDPESDYWNSDGEHTTVYDSEHIKEEGQIFISNKTLIYKTSYIGGYMFEFSTYEEIYADIVQHASIYTEGSFVSLDGKFLVAY